MLGGFVQVRPDERRATLIAFFTLLGVMAAHGLLETARDALFLAKIPATRLPWVYLAVAGIAVALGALSGARRGSRGSRATRLSVLLVACGGVTLAFWPLVGQPGVWALYALYVWSATVATLVVVRFWLMVSERFTVTQAKRVYAFIGAGSVLGAIVGTGLAGALTLSLPARHLLVAAGLSFTLAALGPLLLDRACPKQGGARAVRPSLSPPDPAPEPHAGGSFVRALESPYVRRVALLVLASTIAVTFVDYAFKSAVARDVPKEELGAFFAQFYLILNFVSLAAQLLLVRIIVRLLSTTGSLAVLPLLLAGGGIGIALGGGLGAALAAKGADGALRYSLHRTAMELLYVPMADRVRSVAKTTLDVLGQRGGQALASIAILGLVGLGLSDASFGVMVALVTGAWLALAVGLRRHYLELFRSTLRETALQPRIQFPQLDLSSLESVIATLNSKSDGEVRAALGFLADEGRARLIPGLILYHPSPEVVIDALDILVASGRTDFLPITERLLEHPLPDVRAAALRARISGAPDEAELRRYAEGDCPTLRATALVGLLAMNRADESVHQSLLEIAERGEPESKITLANAFRLRPSTKLEDLLITLARDPNVDVQRAALAAMAVAPNARFLSPLITMLGQRKLRSEARATLVELGDTALSFLAGALADERRPETIRRHIPRTLMRFDAHKAATALVEQLGVERDGVVRYKILRALGFLRAHNPDIRLDREALSGVTKTTVSRIYQLIEWRVVLENGRALHAVRDTPTGHLLTRLLRDKEVHAIERLFRLLGLCYASEDVATIYRGLQSGRADVRASSRELVEHLLEPPLRGAVLGLIDDGSDSERLAAGGPFHQRARPTYEDVLAELLDVTSESLRSIAVYHVGELGLTSLRPRLVALGTEPATGRGLFDRVTARALELLDVAASPELRTATQT